METSDNSKAPGLVRGLGVWSAIAVVMGSTIGTAIFLVSSEMARDLGSAAWVLAAWLIGGVVVLFGTFCYAELGAAMPEAGGDYVYLSRGRWSLWRFLFGWMTVLHTKGLAVILLGIPFFYYWRKRATRSLAEAASPAGV